MPDEFILNNNESGLHEIPPGYGPVNVFKMKRHNNLVSLGNAIAIYSDDGGDDDDDDNDDD